jgi:hypothetical protein
VDSESGLESVSDQEILTFCGNYWEAEDPFSPLFASWQTRRAFSTLRYAAVMPETERSKEVFQLSIVSTGILRLVTLRCDSWAI